MTTARAESTTAAAVPSPDLAAALRGAGLAEVDDSPRRRAEYSSDASNYRVLPGVVAFPRHADGLAAAPVVGTALDVLVRGRLGLIRTEFGRFTRQVSGYSLEHLLPENGADLAKFLVGSEGTLGVVTGATVRLVPSTKAVALAVL